MFLAGLKFSLGLICGLSVFGAVGIGLMAFADWFGKLWRSESKGYSREAERAIVRRERLLLLLRFQNWTEEPMESADRKPTYIQ